MRNLNRQNKRGHLSKKGGGTDPCVLESVKTIAGAVHDLLRSPALHQLFKVIATFVVIRISIDGGVGANFAQQFLRLLKML